MYWGVHVVLLIWCCSSELSVETDLLPESEEFHKVCISACDDPGLIFVQRCVFVKQYVFHCPLVHIFVKCFGMQVIYDWILCLHLSFRKFIVFLKIMQSVEILYLFFAEMPNLSLNLKLILNNLHSEWMQWLTQSMTGYRKGSSLRWRLPAVKWAPFVWGSTHKMTPGTVSKSWR